MSSRRVVTEQPWLEHALCRGRTDLTWFPLFETGGVSAEHRRGIEAAISVCNQCPVKAECREAGIGEAEGIWGGVLKTRNRPAPTDACGTNAGYKRHYRKQEAPCDECRDAHTRHVQQRLLEAHQATVQRIRKMTGRAS